VALGFPSALETGGDHGSLSRSLARAMLTQKLKEALLALAPTGEAGFEGLIQTTLSGWTGLPFYSSRGGRQEGRDGGTGPGSLDVVFETKLYAKSAINDRELLGEIAQATQVCPQLDLYVLATTATIHDLTQRALRNEVEKKDIELLLLDWQPEGPPTLAVFLAKQRNVVLTWFRQHSATAPIDEIEGALDETLAHPAAKVVAEQVAMQLAPDTLGEARLLGRLRAATLSALADRNLARLKFGQFLTPLHSGAMAIPRPRFRDEVAKWWADADTKSLVALIGAEGSGKSWIVPQWWASLTPESAPALLIVPSWRLRGLAEALDGITLLAHAIAWLITDADDSKFRLAIETRLKRWANRRREKPRWLVLLDGGNEATRHPWARTIDSLAQIMEKLDGRVALTSRLEFWRQEIRSRLFEFRPKEISITDFDNDELDRALALRRVKFNELSPQVRNVVRNPRMLSVADSLWPDVGTAALTRDLLLYSYWRLRMQERGNFVAHNESDMRTLLITHAKEIRGGVNSFAVDNWKDYSGAGARLTPQAIQDDLTEIVDGRFFSTDGDRYMPKETALAFALGLLLASELRDSAQASIDDIVDSAIDPIQGVDLTADILASATALSLMDNAPTAVSLTLFRRWIGLQNVADTAFQDVSAYVHTAPTVYFDLLEALYAEPGHPRREWIAEALRLHRDDPNVRDGLISRLKRWMGYWSPDDSMLLTFPRDSEHDRQMREENERHRASVEQAVSALTTGERALFDHLCVQVHNPHLPQIAASVEHIGAGWILAPLAEGVLAWCLAVEICHRSIFRSSLVWLFDMNFTDFATTRAALLAEGGRALDLARCRQFRNAAARVYGFAGLPEDLARFNSLFRLPPELESNRRGWRWVENFCDSDPLDPRSSPPTNLARAKGLIDGIPGDKVRCSFMTTIEDHHVDGLTAGLARFNAEPILALWRRVLDTLSTRDPLAQRQLSLAVPGISPLLKPPDRDAIEALLMAMNDPGHPLNTEGYDFIPTRLLEGVLPHLTGDQQLALLRKLPDVINRMSENLARFFRPADALSFESQLNAAFAESGNGLRMALFFAARIAQPLTPGAVEIVERCLASDDHLARSLAFEVTWRSRDERLLERVRRGSWSADAQPNEMENHYGSGALATAAAIAGDPVPFARLSPHLWGYAADLSQHPEAVEDYGRLLSELLIRMAASKTEAPSPAVVRHVRDDGSGSKEGFATYGRREVGDGEESVQDPKALMEQLSKGFDPQTWKKENELFFEQLRVLGKVLRDEDLTALSDFPGASGFQKLARQSPQRLIMLARSILAIKGQAELMRLKNWVLAMVPVLTAIDSALAVCLYRHVKEARAFVRLISGPAEIPFEVDVLMTSDEVGFAEERRNAFILAGCDEQIALLVLSAEKNGKGAWLRNFARACIGERHPGRMALGITILGLCDEATVPMELSGYQDQIGDLAVSADLATRASERNVWARHWHNQARKAADPVDMWRFGELMVRSADHRWILWFDPTPETPDSPWAQYAELYGYGLQQRGKKRADDRKKTLYGREQPSRLLASLLNFRV
jgi:hypothetical protein